MSDLDALQERLGYRFQEQSRLQRALTHSSATQNRGNSNERLEFLGDRVLGLIIAGMLIEIFPDEDEGELGYRFTALAQQGALARVADDIGISGYIEMSDGEIGSGGRDNPSVTADALEAIIAAMYLDGGLAPAETFIRAHWTRMVQDNRHPPKDPKTRLQEWAQGLGLPLPAYGITEREGPDHQPLFTVSVRVAGQAPLAGQGGNKRAAEQAAAEAMLAAIETERTTP
ncbi:MAG: ribonuclease III [Proteobacteria bacterium]|nr:ribonuclease III [Pseudomonadota bacterium]